MIWEELRDRDWIDFSVAEPTISTFFSAVEPWVPVGSDADLATSDLIHLTAAELALSEGGLEQRLDAPTSEVPFHLHVSEQSARLAVFSSDCGPFKLHNPREQPRLWDVTLFGSDASKLAWSAESDAVEVVADRFLGIVRRLADMYDDVDRRRPPVSASDPTAWRQDVFAARATIWRAKIAVLLDETNITPTLEDVHRAAAGGLPA